MRVLRLAPYRPGLLEDTDGIAIRPDCVKSLEEIRLAHHLAEKAFRSKRNIARKMGYEFLLYVSGTRDIKNAIKKTEPEVGGEFLLVLFSGRPPPGMDLSELGLEEDGAPLELERISLSRIRG